MSVRGKDNFTPDLEKIFQVILMKRRGGYKTNIIITMIDLGQDDFRVLQNTFKNEDVYLYMKSLDQGWMLGTEKPKSIHWSEFCQIPWSSMTVNSSGCVVKCQEDFNGETILGHVSDESLYDIWNGEKYKKLRQDHFNLTPGIQCVGRCDMHKIGEYVK
jgi:radical SAM protein with 4Fe4S-binding SPASM domain